jgi:hypothetical protein
MNVNPETYQKVVVLGDTTRDLINKVRTDSLNVGASNALEDSPPLPPRSAAGSAALERQGRLANAALGAPAVRQHGGGRAPRAPLTQQPGGRRARLIGGEIKSLCCVAAGIIALTSRPCAAHAHPLTRVRRAAHPAAPLRSTPRPHAQLGKGYWLGIGISTSCPDTPVQHFGVHLFCSGKFVPDRLYLFTPIVQVSANQYPNNYMLNVMESQGSINLHEHVFGIQKNVPPHCIALCLREYIKTLIQSIDLRSKIFLIVPTVAVASISLLKFHKKLFNFYAYFETHQRKLMIFPHCVLALFFKNKFPLPSRYRNGDGDAYERANSLHPAGASISGLYRKHHYINQSENYDRTRHCQIPFYYPPYPFTDHLAPQPCSDKRKLGGNRRKRPEAANCRAAA